MQRGILFWFCLFVLIHQVKIVLPTHSWMCDLYWEVVKWPRTSVWPLLKGGVLTKSLYIKENWLSLSLPTSKCFLHRGGTQYLPPHFIPEYFLAWACVGLMQTVSAAINSYTTAPTIYHPPKTTLFLCSCPLPMVPVTFSFFPQKRLLNLGRWGVMYMSVSFRAEPSTVSYSLHLDQL